MLPEVPQDFSLYTLFFLLFFLPLPDSHSISFEFLRVRIPLAPLIPSWTNFFAAGFLIGLATFGWDALCPPWQLQCSEVEGRVLCCQTYPPIPFICGAEYRTEPVFWDMAMGMVSTVSNHCTTVMNIKSTKLELLIRSGQIWCVFPVCIWWGQLK